MYYQNSRKRIRLALLAVMALLTAIIGAATLSVAIIYFMTNSLEDILIILIKSGAISGLMIILIVMVLNSPDKYKLFWLMYNMLIGLTVIIPIIWTVSLFVNISLIQYYYVPVSIFGASVILYIVKMVNGIN